MKNKSVMTVSVIIPTHNRSSLLEKTIASMRCQTHRDIEILVCDDGSTDDTKNIVSNISEIDPRVIYIYCGKNGRPAIPRNIGIKNAKGDWLAFCDDDDTWLPTKLESQLYMMKKYNVKASCTNAYRVEDGKITNQTYFKNLSTCLYGFISFQSVNPVMCSSMVIHRSLIEKCKGFPEQETLRAIEDYALWFRVACFTKVVYLNYPLIEYVMASSSSIRLKESLSFEEQKSIVAKDFLQWAETQSVFVRMLYYASVIKYKVFSCFIAPFREMKNLALSIYRGILNCLR